jgi:uncharacterized protein YdeI (BOF family)
MKKFIVIAVILMCCLVYAIVKFSMSENQNAYKQTEETQSAKQINADDTDKATPEEGSGSAVPAEQVEAVTKAFSDFQNAIKSEDYEQAWKLTSEFIKSQGSFEDFKKSVAGEMAELANAIIHPESAINIEGRVELRATIRHKEQDMDLYMSFIQEDGQWKLYGGRPVQSVDNSKE